MRLVIFLILVMFGSCTQTKNYSVNFRSKNIYDIEVYNGRIIYFCSKPSDPGEPRRFLNIYLLTPGRTDHFFSRRKLEPEECPKWVAEIEKIYKNSKTLRIIGIEGKEETYQDKEISEHLGLKESLKVESTWFLSRVVTDKGCFGHFGGECTPGYSEKKRFIDP